MPSPGLALATAKLKIMKLYFEDTASDKPPLLLVAGLASDELSWLYQKEEFAASYRLITCDNRGVGRSAKPAGPYTIAEMAADIVELLDDLGLEKVHILGHSMGGAVAQFLAIEEPHRVDKMVLACTFSKPTGRSVAVVRSWTGVLELGASPELLGNCLFPWLYSDPFLSAPGCLQACVEALAQHPFPLEAAPISAQVAALEQFDSSSHLHRIQAPTLVVAAECDLLVPPKACRTLAEAIPGARYEELPGTAHSCMLETPKIFNKAVLEFL